MVQKAIGFINTGPSYKVIKNASIAKMCKNMVCKCFLI